MPAIGIVFGIAVLSVSFGFVYYAFTIRREFPDLNDPSPGVDAYWPAVEHMISHLIAGVAALVGLPILGISAWQFWVRRSNKG